jgi:hypothetical protein
MDAAKSVDAQFTLDTVTACPASSMGGPYVTGRFAYVFSYIGQGGDTLNDFIGAGCTAQPTGTMPPSTCMTGVYNTWYYVGATWPNTAARAAAGVNDGCQFNCPGGTCFVRATDGLPVELMKFSVEPEDTTNSPP